MMGRSVDLTSVKVDLLVTGAVAVDRTGRRLGKGTGYFDQEYQKHQILFTFLFLIWMISLYTPCPKQYMRYYKHEVQNQIMEEGKDELRYDSSAHGPVEPGSRVQEV